MKNITVLLAATLVLGAFAGSEVRRLTDDQMKSMTEERSFTASNGMKLGYRVHLPADKTKKYPLLVLMHGAGETGDDNFKQLKNGAPYILGYIAEGEKHECVFIAPQCPAGHRWMEEEVWKKPSHTFTEKPAAPLAAAIELIENAIATLPVDPDRVYLTGLSMGGFATWDILARRRDLFAAAIPVCGGGDPAYASKLLDLPIWVTHALNDACVSVSYPRSMMTEFWRLGAKNIRYSEYWDGGHWIWDPTYRDRQYLNWLFSKSRKPAESAK